MLIIRRSKLHYTASGIITPIGGHLVHRLREGCSPLSICAPDGVMIPEAVHYTASGIITPIVGRLAHRLREDCSPLSTCARDGVMTPKVLR